jgi:Tol biopolymer transport system component
MNDAQPYRVNGVYRRPNDADQLIVISYPVISPDARSLLFSSNRDAKPGERAFTLYLMDISSLGLEGSAVPP